MLGELADNAVECAYSAACHYLIPRNHALTGDERLCRYVQDEANRDLEAALADAKDAIACRMLQVAAVSFAASMAIAGIRAAKRLEEEESHADLHAGRDE